MNDFNKIMTFLHDNEIVFEVSVVTMTGMDQTNIILHGERFYQIYFDEERRARTIHRVYNFCDQHFFCDLTLSDMIMMIGSEEIAWDAKYQAGELDHVPSEWK